MTSRFVLAVALLAVLPALAFSQSPTSIPNATVVQTDGWTHRHVTVALLEGGASVRVTRDDGESLTLPVTSVALIRDAAGRDVTYQVIPGAEPPPPSTDDDIPAAAVETTPAGPTYTAKPKLAFTSTLGVGTGWGSPSGDFYTGFEAGQLYYADARIATGPRNYVKFTYRSQQLLQDQIAILDPYEDIVLGILDLTVDIREYIVTAGFLSHATPGDLLRAYAEVGLGWGDHVIKGEIDGISDTVHEGRLLLCTQIGVLLPFGRSNVGLDLGISVAAKILNAESNEGGGVIFGAQAGLVVLFGRETHK